MSLTMPSSLSRLAPLKFKIRGLPLFLHLNFGEREGKEGMGDESGMLEVLSAAGRV